MKIQELKKLNEERMANAKKTVDRQGNFIALADTIAKSLKNIDPRQYKEVTNALSSLSAELRKLPGMIDKMNAKDSEDILDCLRSVKEAIDNKNFSPNIDVKSPTIPKIDVNPIAKAIGELKEDKGIDLDNYRGVAIDNDSDVMQYIGFVNPQGEWYIACNDMESNRMTYVFGRDQFTSAWESHMNLGYNMLNIAVAEAYSEVSA